MLQNNEKTAEHRTEAGQRKLPGAKLVHDVVRLEGEEELSRHFSGLAWSGLAAGLAMGFSMAITGGST